MYPAVLFSEALLNNDLINYTYKCKFTMKRKYLERQLKRLGWNFMRRSRRHDIWTNGDFEIVVPGHNEINEYTAKSILSEAKGEN